MVGRFTQAGREWQPSGEPEEVSTYDFPSLAEGKAIPYGVYDIADDSAWVSVGVDHDTSVFAVATIEQWWEQMGKTKYPNARRLLIKPEANPPPRRSDARSPADRAQPASSGRSLAMHRARVGPMLPMGRPSRCEISP